MGRLLALDQASKVTGWAVFVDEKLEKFGKIETNLKDLGCRLYEIREKVKKLIKEYNIDEVVFEDIQLQDNISNNVQTFKILSEVYGVIDELLTELDIPHTAVLAGTWKSTLSIKGKKRPEQKRAAQEYVINTYGVKATQDECDAICIGTHMLYKDKNVGFDWSD